jgi:hypothetical protein
MQILLRILSYKILHCKQINCILSIKFNISRQEDKKEVKSLEHGAWSKGHGAWGRGVAVTGWSPGGPGVWAILCDGQENGEQRNEDEGPEWRNDR